MRSEYDPSGSQARANAQSLFLQAIRDCEEVSSPQYPVGGRPCRVLAELNGTPLQRFQALYDCTHNGFSSDLLQWNLFGEAWTEENAARRSEVFNVYAQLSGYDAPIPNLMNNISPAQYFAWVRLREAIIDWATTWNLAKWEGNDPWFFNHVLSTLHLWCLYPQPPNEMDWALVSYSIESLPVQSLRGEIKFDAEADLTLESRVEAKKRLMRTAEEAVNDFLDQRETLEEQRGATKSKDIRSVDPFKMLVRYVIQEWSTEAVRAAFGYQNRNDVSRSSTRTANLIGLTIPNRQGRRYK